MVAFGADWEDATSPIYFRSLLKNVWPAPSARGLCKTIRPVCVNVSGLGATAPAKMEVRAPWSS